MTIAAGFFYRGGLLLCTDTQATGSFKMHGSKLLPQDYDDGTITIFATVGNIPYARMGVQLAELAIQDMKSRTANAIHRLLEEQVYSLHLKHLYAHPSWNLDANLRVSYLIGVWAAADRQLAFFKTDDTAVERLHGYECLGSGSPLAHYLIRPRYERRPSVHVPHVHNEDEVRKLAYEALEEVKSHDPYCGGDTQWFTITDDGKRVGGIYRATPSAGLPTPRQTKRGR